MEESRGKEIGVGLAEIVVENVLFVVGNRTGKRTRRQFVDAALGGGERVESEEGIIGC